MKISIKDLSVAMELKQIGMELAVRDNQDVFLGNLVATSTGVIWCNGKTKRENGDSNSKNHARAKPVGQPAGRWDKYSQSQKI